ncbi:oxygen-insensitive NADPH nitroreductase [Gilliamella sp. Pra-s65]|uniref:oxygen-insensitive NADPH nitroreductase n=1 Tax=unclassified Gilliamella TaxID=2685620 RepID=UPI0013657755|nr:MULTISPECIES: oxygen-insensitive NADPH nitroreductase [unclassified Gilliamella]MWN89735.1 oxygen-insensitive NADPH nitroreductase [Gilliamella sp. Pra-s65]MWP47260.1 oxygen-insensitive NADPH nitroreductase [Gilliamella sp. Pas-s27]MWP72743.1 oxygen-insensitive NADPH nitroreductase [Gilliamella sp. Pra-s52]
MQNEIIDLICRHRSIRAYKSTPLTQVQIESIIQAAQSASSSNFLQCTTIIRITDTSIRKQLAHYAGDQSYINQAPEFWVFCADFNRHYQIEPSIPLEKAEQLLVGCIDTAIMAQNTVIAAESLGLGTVYIGGLRNNIDKVTELLTLPKYVIPLFGLCIGYPDQNPEIKPRLPKELVFFENNYQPINHALLAQYDTQMNTYYQQRSTHPKAGGWSDKIAHTIIKGQRSFILDYLHKQGWIKK